MGLLDEPTAWPQDKPWEDGLEGMTPRTQGCWLTPPALTWEGPPPTISLDPIPDPETDSSGADPNGEADGRGGVGPGTESLWPCAVFMAPETTPDPTTLDDGSTGLILGGLPPDGGGSDPITGLEAPLSEDARSGDSHRAEPSGFAEADDTGSSEALAPEACITPEESSPLILEAEPLAALPWHRLYAPESEASAGRQGPFYRHGGVISMAPVDWRILWPWDRGEQAADPETTSPWEWWWPRIAICGDIADPNPDDPSSSVPGSLLEPFLYPVETEPAAEDIPGLDDSPSEDASASLDASPRDDGSVPDTNVWIQFCQLNPGWSSYDDYIDSAADLKSMNSFSADDDWLIAPVVTDDRDNSALTGDDADGIWMIPDCPADQPPEDLPWDGQVPETALNLPWTTKPRPIVVVCPREPGEDPTLRAYQSFLKDNPTWPDEHGAGGIQPQVITASSHLPWIDLSTPGAARAFDAWFERNVMAVRGREAEPPEPLAFEAAAAGEPSLADPTATPAAAADDQATPWPSPETLRSPLSQGVPSQRRDLPVASGIMLGSPVAPGVVAMPEASAFPGKAGTLTLLAASSGSGTEAPPEIFDADQTPGTMARGSASSQAPDTEAVSAAAALPIALPSLMLQPMKLTALPPWLLRPIRRLP